MNSQSNVPPGCTDAEIERHAGPRCETCANLELLLEDALSHLEEYEEMTWEKPTGRPDERRRRAELLALISDIKRVV